jgi:hypothetical protein
MNPRYFRNSPQFTDFADVERYADALAAIVVKGYTGPDRTLRACCEIPGEAVERERAFLLDSKAAREQGGRRAIKHR